MTEQERIIFKNLASRSLGGYCRNYSYKSIGNIIHWIYVYANLDISEKITIGDGVVKLYNKDFAIYTLDDSLSMPIFKFDSKYDFISDVQDIFLRGLKDEECKKYYDDMVDRYHRIKEMF